MDTMRQHCPGVELARAEPSTGFEIKRVAVNPLRGDLWALVVNGNEGLAQLSSDGEQKRFIQLFTNVPDLIHYELPRSFAFDPYAELLWVGMWVIDQRHDDRTGAVITLDRKGRQLQRLSLPSETVDIVIQRLNVDIAMLSESQAAWHHKRRIAVALLSRQNFDPLQVNVRSVHFGPAGAGPDSYDAKDVNKDGIADLLLYFDAEDTGLRCDDKVTGLSGWTRDKLALAGSTHVHLEHCRH
jgi:hypothetical protein